MTDDKQTTERTNTRISLAGRSSVSSLVKSTTKLWATPHHYEYNERSLAPQVHIQSAPGPAPLPPLSPHSTHTHAQTHKGHSRARGLTLQFQHTKTHTSPYPVREEKRVTEVAEEKLGEDEGERVNWDYKVCGFGEETHSEPVIMEGMSAPIFAQSIISTAFKMNKFLDIWRHKRGQNTNSVCCWLMQPVEYFTSN